MIFFSFFLIFFIIIHTFGKFKVCFFTVFSSLNFQTLMEILKQNMTIKIVLK